MSETIKPSIPDVILPYLSEIAERLLSGHAAVMVGAGFSRNAKPNSASSSDFPDWLQLGDIFYEKIHRKKPDKDSKYLNVLKLADEVQAAFGRSALNQILRDAIPDYDMVARDLNRNDIRNMCHHLLLSMMRHYREQGLLEKWETSCNKIQQDMANLSPEHKASFHYECALYSFQEREDYGQVLLVDRLRDALTRINPDVPSSGIEEAVRRIAGIVSPDLVVSNRAFHRLLTDGVDVEVAGQDGSSGVRHLKVWLLDLENLNNNDWMALNQYTVIEDNRNRRPDVVVFVNGLPLAVLELKNPGDENATIRHAFKYFQTYKSDIPSLFITNELLVILDGIQARCGTLTSGWDKFGPWRTIDGESIAPKDTPELEWNKRRRTLCWNRQKFSVGNGYHHDCADSSN